MTSTNNFSTNSGPRVPLYQRLKDYVLGDIRAGRLRPRDRVPSEQELVEQFGVSRMTANRALRELASDGYLVRQTGVGTFVAETQVRSHMLQVRNIADEIIARKHRHSAVIITHEHAAAGIGIAQRLGLPSATQLFHTLIIHYENDRPIQAEDRYVSPAAAPEYLQQDFTRITPNEYLSRVAPLQTVEHVISARIPDERIRDLLEMCAGEPSLVIDRLTWSGDRPVSAAQLHHPASRYELTAKFDADEPGPGRRGSNKSGTEQQYSKRSNP